MTCDVDLMDNDVDFVIVRMCVNVLLLFKIYNPDSFERDLICMSYWMDH